MKPARTIFNWLGSLELTIASLTLMMLLIFFGTIAQTSIGTFAAQRQYFNQFFVWGRLGGAHLPMLPGGLTIGLLWLVNLVAAFIVRFRFEKKSTGILISHFGLIVLLAGQGLTQLFAVESQMPVQEGATANYSESSFEPELAVVNVSDPATDEVVSIPPRLFDHPNLIHTPALPFDLRVVRYFRNADLAMGGGDAVATQGVGTRVSVREIPPTESDDERNTTTAYVEVLKEGRSLGTWLLSVALGAPQSVTVDGKEYRLALRPKRIYYPYTITLKDFRHDIYKGTDIPKNFSSLVHIDNPATGESRDTLIYMNHPLRYRGSTFYQASFAENDTVSIFQVVQNPAWLTPYIACFLVALGLAIQFGFHLTEFLKERRAS
jgi:hypothetical protein